MLKNRLCFLLALALFFVSMDCHLLSATTSRDPFPVYGNMRANVAFWKKVYGTYPSSKGLIHDSRDLSVIYEVLDLVEQDQAGAAKMNAERMEKARNKYAAILRSLAGGRAKNAEEKRVLALFGARPSASRLREAADSIRFQLCLKERFAEGVVRSGAYLAEIKKIFKGYGLPEDLAYLPHVESSFNYRAYSKAGAAGIWQFTRDTGKRFMTIDYTVDERRDPIRATHAAARFLRDNYQKLGSWPMALTAYNHGTAGMMRAQKALGSYERIFDRYDGKRFGFASRNFYSEFIAAREVAKNYKHYFGSLQLNAPVHHHEVRLSGYAPIKELARHFQVDVATLRELNPALRPPVFEGSKHVPKDYLLRLPGRSQGQRLAGQELPSSVLSDRQKPSRFYRVGKGDTAGSVARSLGVTLADLAAANNLDRRMVIVVGQNLRIPYQEEKRAPAARPTGASVPLLTAASGKNTPVQRSGEPRLLQASVLKKSVSAPKAAEEENGAAAPAAETVLAEESGQLERQAALAQLPQGTLDETEVNQAVVIGNLQVEEVVRKNGNAEHGVIRVEAGETIGHYAGWLKVPSRTILRWNGMRSANALRFGKRLLLYFNKVSPEEFEESRYEFHKEIEEDFFAAYRIDGARLYRIQAGDNIWRLCEDEFDLPAWLVLKYNSAHDFNNLKLDDQLIIPVVSRKEKT